MEFFDKKEDVLDVQLTEYGKYLLSTGRMRPVYYAFFDDDILYDTNAASFSEDQNSAEPRIQKETPRLKVAPTRTGAETRVQSILDMVVPNLNSSDPANNVEVFDVQSFESKGKIAAHPIGNSSLDSKYNASWTLEVLSEPDITTSQTHLESADGAIDNIPQINITIDYETFFKSGTNLTADSISDFFPDSSIFLALKENYLMLELMEENTAFQKENFEVEVYLSGSSSGYQQLVYTPTDEEQFIEPTVDNVEYYMNILMDNDIPREVIEELNISDRAVRTNAARLRLNRDLYTTQDEEPC